MIKKQQSLNIHFIPCAKIMHWFNKVTSNRDAKVINTKEFYTILRAINLLKADCSMTDERWQRFYSKFMVVEQAQGDGLIVKRYLKRETQVALFFLAHGSPAERARAICELYMDQIS